MIFARRKIFKGVDFSCFRQLVEHKGVFANTADQRIGTSPTLKRVVGRTASDEVIACAAENLVVALPAFEIIGPIIADDHVAERVSDAIDIVAACQGQVLDIGR